MRYLILLFLLISCQSEHSRVADELSEVNESIKAFSPEDQKELQYEMDNFDIKLKERRIEKETEIYLIDGCEYIVFTSYSSKEYAVVHKANCSNNFHKNR